jgi:hypothetical protein
MDSDCAWQALADRLADAAWHAMWFLYGGLVAFGSCWCFGCGAYGVWQEWDRDWLRRRGQRRIDREVARGLRQVEEFLQQQTPARTEGSDGAKPSRGYRGHRRRPSRG